MLIRSRFILRMLNLGLLLTFLSSKMVNVASEDGLSDCEPVNGVTPICGFQSPEDLEVMPGDRLIVVSEYGGLSGAKPGALSSYHTIDGTIERLFPKNTDAAQTPTAGKPLWGDQNCPGPPSAAFDPHGIYHNSDTGMDRLLVVNHGGREAIELFELTIDADGNSLSLNWRGCVVAPPGIWFNDVVGLRGGGLVATHMMPRDFTREQIFASEVSQADTGYALEWQVEKGWRKLPGTDGALTNGIEVSPDGKVLYINYYLGGKVIAVDRQSGTHLWTVEVAGPDNSSWAPDGTLLVATHQNTTLEAILRCSDSDIPYCPVAYEIIAIDPATGSHSLRFKGSGAPMAAATVAVQINQTLYLGSFAGQRMGRHVLAP